MSAIHEVLRRLNDLAQHSTQDEHDRLAALIDQDESGPKSAPPAVKES